MGGLLHKPLNSLGLITIVVFTWYWCVKRDVKASISIIAFYAGLALPGILLGWMDTYSVYPFLGLIGLMAIADWIRTTPSALMSFVGILLLNGIVFTLYILQLVEPIYALMFGMGSVSVLIVRLLRRKT